MKRSAAIALASLLALVVLSMSATAHLCDNVFRQADRLIVKPETYNIVVKDRTTFKIFLQNNMDRGIAEISLQASSSAFDFVITPARMSIPKDARAYFEVTMIVKSNAGTGSYPVSFRLTGGGRQFKSFSLNSRGESNPASSLLQVKRASTSPSLDGVLNDAIWRSAAVVSNFSSTRGGKALFPTVALLTYDGDALTIGVRCSDEATDSLTADDRLDIFLAVNATRKPTYHIRVAATGTASFGKYLDTSSYVQWDCKGGRFDVSREKKAWSAEIAVPFAALGIRCPASAQKWCLRIDRNKASGTKEKSYWAADSSGYNSESNFGEILVAPGQ